MKDFQFDTYFNHWGLIQIILVNIRHSKRLLNLNVLTKLKYNNLAILYDAKIS